MLVIITRNQRRIAIRVLRMIVLLLPHWQISYLRDLVSVTIYYTVFSEIKYCLVIQQTSNNHATKIMRRIRQKLEGIDFDVKHKMNVTEQVREHV